MAQDSLCAAHVALRPLAIPACQSIQRQGGGGGQEGERVARVHRPRRILLGTGSAAWAHLIRRTVDSRNRTARPWWNRRELGPCHWSSVVGDMDISTKAV